ncbi:hypothetical protein E6R60_07235 [Streptomyces sp. A0642]|nr:hypothetical protein E6R60_07235 [Streptomyces sp. A0642]
MPRQRERRGRFQRHHPLRAGHLQGRRPADVGPHRRSLTRTLTGHTVWPTAVWLGPDARRAVSAGSDAEIRVWDMGSGECVVFPHPGSWVSSVCLSPDGRLVLAAGQHRGRPLWLLDAGTGDFVRAFEDVQDSPSLKDPGDRSGEVQTARFTSDGRFVVTGEDDGRIRIWETATGRYVRTLVGHTDEVYGIALTPDDRMLLSGSLDGTLKLWELDWESTPSCSGPGPRI